MPKEYGYGGESASSKSGKVGMPGGHPIHKHMSNSAFMKKGGVMDADTEDMPLKKDMTGGRKGSMVQMNHKGSPAGMHSPMHKGHKGGMPMNQKGSAMPMYGPAKMYGKKK